LFNESNAGGGFLAQDSAIVANPTTAPLATQRTQAAMTLVGGATVAFISPYLQFTTTVGAAVNFTLRIGAPQLELGAFLTSLILPAAGTPAASTRASDIAVMPLGPLASANAYSMAVEASLPQLEAASLMSVDDSTGNNRSILSTAANGTALAQTLSSFGGLNSYSVPPANLYVPGIIKLALAQSETLSVALNGGAAAVVAAPILPVGITTLRFGRNVTGSAQMNGYLRRARYWPRALSNAELKAATT
jgi:hypothetical protein